MLPSPGQDQATDASTQAALSRILEGTASEIGEGFFRALVREPRPCARHPRRLGHRVRSRARGVSGRSRSGSAGQWIEGFEQSDRRHAVPGGHREPASGALPGPDPRAVPGRAEAPAAWARSATWASPSRTSTGRVLGHLAVLDIQPMPDDPDPPSAVRDLRRARRGRAAAAAGRARRSASVRRSSRGWSSSAMDAIVQLDGELRVTRDEPGGGAHLRDPCRARPTGCRSPR